MKRFILILAIVILPGCYEKAEQEMVLIPEGYFISGIDGAQDPQIMKYYNEIWPNETEDFYNSKMYKPMKRKDSCVPSKKIYLKAFYIDKYEVSRAAYLDCVKAGQCRKLDIHFFSYPNIVSRAAYLDCVKAGQCWKPDIHFFFYPNLPVGKVNYLDAKNYCRFVGKRLPTDREWEKAARGPDGNLFPWGNEYNEKCRTGSILRDVTDGDECKSYYGVFNMFGNAWEWTVPHDNPDSWSESIMMGGGIVPQLSACGRLYDDNEFEFAVYTYQKHIGFRCVKDVVTKNE